MMAADVKLLPLPEGDAIGWSQAWSHDQMRDYARANVLHHFQSRVELLAEALRAERRWWVDRKADAIREQVGGLTRGDPGAIARCDAAIQRIDAALAAQPAPPAASVDVQTIALIANMAAYIRAEGGENAGALLSHADKLIDSAGGAKVCTCPSGDGSLRWPCPQHPPQETPVVSGGRVVAWLKPDWQNPENFDGLSPVTTYERTDWQPLVLQSDLAAAIARAEAAERDAARLKEALHEAMEWNWLDDDARPSRVADFCDAAIAAQQAEGEDRG